MKGKIMGVSVFLLLAASVSLAAVGAVSQAVGNGEQPGVTSMAVAEYGAVPEKAEPRDEGGIYGAFTYVCPFH